MMKPWLYSVSARAIAIACASLAFGVDPARAAMEQGVSQAAPAADSSKVEEIVVTAQRRETRLQDTPIAITALSNEALARAGINRVEDISRLVPGLSIPGASLNNNQAVAIRGISFYSGITSVSYPVAFYIDGLFTDRPYSIRDHLFDVQRIEVLRGPQGVLFGRNATAGAIQIIHTLPSNELAVLGRVEAGSYDTQQAQFSIRGPIVRDRIQVGLAGQYAHSGGYVTNDVTGHKLFGETSKGVRGTIRLLPTDGLQVILRGSYAQNRNSFGIKNILSFGTKTKEAIFDDPAYAPYHLGNDYEGFTNRKTSSASIEASYDAGPVELHMLTGYQGFKQNSHGDSDGTAVRRSENEQRHVNYGSVSSEWRLATTGDGPIHLDLGVYYIREHPHEFDNDVRMYTLTAGTYRRTGGTYFRNQETIADSYAGFAHVAYRPTERLTLRVGGRYSKEKKRINLDFDLFNATGFTTTVASASKTFHAFTPSFGVDYRWPGNILTYATVSKGFKSGGFNISPVVPFSPESVWNYEVGMKSDLFDRRLRLNLAAFYMDYRNIQVSKNTGNGLALIQNAAASTIKGIEAEAELRPFQGLVLSGSLAYLDAKYDQFILDDRNPTGTNIAGATLNRAPKWKGALTAEYERPVTEALVGGLRASYSRESSVYFETLLPTARLAFRRPSIQNLDLRASVRAEDHRWELAGVIRNATNERYISNLQNLLGGATRGAFFSQPRYFGGEISVRY